MGAGIEPDNEPAKTSAPIPFSSRITACRSLAEAVGTAAGIMADEFGATAVAVLDSEGPVTARPARVPTGLIIDLIEAPEGISRGAPGRVDDGLTFMAHPIRGTDGMRIAAAWSTTTVPRNELRAMAEILADWLEAAGRPAARTVVPRPLGMESLSQGDFSRLVDTIPTVVYVAGLGTNARWTYISPQIETLLGYTPAEWLADPGLWSRSIHPDDLEHALSFEDERLIGLDIDPPAEYRMRARDGRYVWVYERARLIRAENGEPTWYGVMQDITPLKSAEREIERNASRQALVAELARMAVRGGDPDLLLAAATERIAALDRVLEVSIWELGDDESLHLLHRSGEIGTATVIPFVPEGFPGENLLRGEPIFIPSWSSEDPRLGIYRQFVPPEAASSFAAPILGTNQNFGMILIHSAEQSAFTEDDSDFLVGTASVLGNAIERSRSDRSLHHRLNHDALTELPNRRYFTVRLEQALAEARRNHKTVALIFLDVDRFKLINDGIGHKAGDEVLRAIAPRLSRSVRHGDTVARFGGDEFGIVLCSVADVHEASEVAERVLAAVSEPVRVEGTERRVTASIGISTWNHRDDPKSPEDLIQEADAAMYQAKESGRAQTRIFDGMIHRKMLHRLEVERELHSAIENDELTVLYQPIIELKHGHLTGFEALVRWQHPHRGLLAPDEFIPIAEESELIREIDTRVLRKAVAEAARWNRGLLPGRQIGVSVNCSARQTGNRDLPELVSGLLSNHRLAPRLLTIELTETVLLSGSSQVNHIIASLDRIGVHLSLDDFGTGFSSLGYLAEFPLNEIKIDRRFVTLLGRGDHRGSAIADAIVQIGRALSMTVVAEGVPDDQTLTRVRDLGCHRAQGFLIGTPLDPEAARDLIDRTGPAYAIGAASR